MALETIQLLQIGDVHWPNGTELAMDNQRGQRFQAADRSTLSDVKNVNNYLMRYIIAADAILLMGDLTDRGELGHYHSFLEWFTEIVGDEGRSKVQIVPGNHDIDRSLCFDDDERYLQKFEPLQQALRDRAFPDMPVDGPVFRPIDRGSASLRVVALNSCIGCGASRRSIELPGELKEKFVELADLGSAMYELLDTPLFHPDHLTSTVSLLSTERPAVLPVVVAHHNLLPQERIRAMAYGELMNGGAARARLMELARPVLYLHGHIHASPVEVITSPKKPRSKVISICAPEFTRGFNRILVDFSRQRQPLGCILEEWRPKDHGSQILEKQTTRIPYWSPAAAGEIMTQNALEIFKTLKAKGLKSTGTTVKLGRSLPDEHPHQEDFVEGVRELEWLGVLEVSNRDIEGQDEPSHPSKWEVRRLI